MLSGLNNIILPSLFSFIFSFNSVPPDIPTTQEPNVVVKLAPNKINLALNKKETKLKFFERANIKLPEKLTISFIPISGKLPKDADISLKIKEALTLMQSATIYEESAKVANSFAINLIKSEKDSSLNLLLASVPTYPNNNFDLWENVFKIDAVIFNTILDKYSSNFNKSGDLFSTKEICTAFIKMMNLCTTYRDAGRIGYTLLSRLQYKDKLELLSQRYIEEADKNFKSKDWKAYYTTVFNALNSINNM